MNIYICAFCFVYLDEEDAMGEPEMNEDLAERTFTL